MRKNANGLRRLLQGTVVYVAASPYARALRSAKIIARSFKKRTRPPFGPVDVLKPGVDPVQLARWLRSLDASATVILVGHEPDCSNLVSYFCAGSSRAFVKFSKAGGCLIDFPSGVGKRRGELQWLAPPELLGAADS